jgi:ergothioneine biosynthesis protein EgtB
MLATKDDLGVQHGFAKRIADARERSDELFHMVKPDSLYDRPIPERHRIIFYLGHLEAFDWNLLRERVLGVKSLHPEFDRLFAFGIDPVGGGLPDDQPCDWPSIPQVREYAAKIREMIDENLGEEAVLRNVGEFPVNTLLNVAIEHRLMHAETLAYMLHQLPVDRKIRQAQQASPSLGQVQPTMLDIPAGAVTLGMNRGDHRFGWDNEFEALAVDVPPFAIDKYKVTNREYVEFVNQGGYESRGLWTEEDWQWKTACAISCPSFWRQDGEQWLYRGMFEELPLPLDAPVFVSHAEAKAYAQWVGKNLPTEAEWQRAAYGGSNGAERAYPWGNANPSSRHGNFDFAGWDPAPVNAFPDGDSAFGVADLLGNGWEWTSTPFAPFPGFERYPFYPGYSADFFDGKHFVMKGGSARTAACMLRRSFRNWFQSHYQYVYAGFRCVRR